MPAALLDPAVAYLRKQCGLPMRPATMMPSADPDDPAGRLLTTAEAADAAHVSEATIRDWARARKPLLCRANPQDDGPPLYREIDVLIVEAQTRRGPRSRALAAEALEGLDSPAT